jgi:flagellar protein FliO/FliZ
MRRRLALLAALPAFAAGMRAAGDVLYPRGAPQAGEASAAAAGPGISTWVVAGICAVAGAWFLWRSRRHSSMLAPKGRLSVAETKSLGNRQYLVVAGYGSQKFLIGVCVGRVSLLAELKEDSKAPSP